MRAASIALVLIAHVVTTQGFPFQAGALSHVGNIGVRVFFLISGFLITSLLLRELERDGRISIAQFYLRRTLRIFPAFFAYVLLVWLAATSGFIRLEDGDLFHSVTYTMNYHHDRSWFVNHLWSLSVEEQFYILWPFALLFFGLRPAMRGAAAFLVLAPAIRVLMHYSGSSDSAMTREFQAVGDALATGCLLAYWYNRFVDLPSVARMLTSPWFPIVPGLGLVASVAFGTQFYYLFGQTIANLAIASGLLWITRQTNTITGRVLNSRPIVLVGTLSYSLYLWQEPFLNPDWSHWLTAFPQNIALTVFAALISYALIERPFLAYKKSKLSSPSSG
jgi:peptidoglycan/LPS O-acetylase OafA/YrhL